MSVALAIDGIDDGPTGLIGTMRDNRDDKGHDLKAMKTLRCIG